MLDKPAFYPYNDPKSRSYTDSGRRSRVMKYAATGNGLMMMYMGMRRMCMPASPCSE